MTSDQSGYREQAIECAATSRRYRAALEQVVESMRGCDQETWRRVVLPVLEVLGQ